MNREQSMRPSLAASYSNLAQHYFIFDKIEKAENYSLQAINMYKNIKNREDGAFDTDLARNFNALANLYVKNGNPKQAEACYKEAIMLYIKLFEKSPRAYVDRIINTINNIVMFFDPIESAKWMEDFIDEDRVMVWLQNELL